MHHQPIPGMYRRLCWAPAELYAAPVHPTKNRCGPSKWRRCWVPSARLRKPAMSKLLVRRGRRYVDFGPAAGSRNRRVARTWSVCAAASLAHRTVNTRTAIPTVTCMGSDPRPSPAKPYRNPSSGWANVKKGRSWVYLTLRPTWKLCMLCRWRCVRVPGRTEWSGNLHP